MTAGNPARMPISDMIHHDAEPRRYTCTCELAHDGAIQRWCPAHARALRSEIDQLRQRVKEWEGWYEGVVADFVGLTTDASDPQRLHDWEWMDDYRPAPYRMQMD